MSLSPVDISSHEFSRSLRGYDPAEVRAFLERLADEIADLQSQVNSLAEQSRIYSAKLSAYQEMEQSLRDSLVATQENQRSAHEMADRERQQILREAHADAEHIKLAAERESLALREELRALKLHRDAFVKRLRFLLKSQSELIDLIEQESPEVPDARSKDADR
ncbi:DivIVA domain-containing protein [bacterium]|nr:DivIVA domain-containing protein [bacterium]MBU1985218.1 DivIVA domain-containing protein [bacterium]